MAESRKYYKVIAKNQSIARSIAQFAKLLELHQVIDPWYLYSIISSKIAILIANFRSITISIAKIQSIVILYKLLELPLQNTKAIVILITE